MGASGGCIHLDLQAGGQPNENPRRRRRLGGDDWLHLRSDDLPPAARDQSGQTEGEKAAGAPFD